MARSPAVRATCGANALHADVSVDGEASTTSACVTVFVTLNPNPASSALARSLASCCSDNGLVRNMASDARKSFPTAKEGHKIPMFPRGVFFALENVGIFSQPAFQMFSVDLGQPHRCRNG